MFSLRCLSVCLSVGLLATLSKNFRTDLHEIFRKGWQRANEQMIKVWWRSGSTSGFTDCFPDWTVLGDTESCINRLRCATLQCRPCTSRHRHSNCNVMVCTVSVLLVTGSIARSAKRRYLSYSEADFEVFRPAGVTRCTDGAEIWRGREDQRSHSPCQISLPSVQR